MRKEPGEAWSIIRLWCRFDPQGKRMRLEVVRKCPSLPCIWGSFFEPKATLRVIHASRIAWCSCHTQPSPVSSQWEAWTLDGCQEGFQRKLGPLVSLVSYSWTYARHNAVTHSIVLCLTSSSPGLLPYVSFYTQVWSCYSSPQIEWPPNTFRKSSNFPIQ